MVKHVSCLFSVWTLDWYVTVKMFSESVRKFDCMLDVVCLSVCCHSNTVLWAWGHLSTHRSNFEVKSRFGSDKDYFYFNLICLKLVLQLQQILYLSLLRQHLKWSRTKCDFTVSALTVVVWFTAVSAFILTDHDMNNPNNFELIKMSLLAVFPRCTVS